MIDYTISKLDISAIPPELYTYCEECKIDSVINNSSIKNMKIGSFESEAWWATWVDNKIISVSGMHKWPEMGEDCWRVMFRTATLKEYRGIAGPITKRLSNDFNWGKILPYQLSYGKLHGARKFLFTTNSDKTGDPGSYKTNRVVSTAFVDQGLVRLVSANIILYNTIQNLWEVI